MGSQVGPLFEARFGVTENPISVHLAGHFGWPGGLLGCAVSATMRALEGQFWVVS